MAMSSRTEQHLAKIDTEAHFWTPGFVSYLRERTDTPRQEVVDDNRRRLYYDGSTPDLVLTHGDRLEDNLLELGEARLAHMDELGIDIQILSLSGPSVEQFAPEDALSQAKLANDYLGEIVRRWPSRFVGLATLAPDLAEESAEELERCVRDYGFRGANIMSHVGDSYLDEQRFSPIFAMAEHLGVIVNLHPTVPHNSMIKPYLGYGWAMPAPGLGFGHETAVHAMRLIYSGLFDRYPKLQMMLGHFGEALPFWAYRIDFDFIKPWMDASHRPKLERRPSDYLKQNWWYNCSGNFLDAAMVCCLTEIGADRVMFATDYPWETMEDAVAFIDRAQLADADRAKLCYGNAARVFNLASELDAARSATA
jgi:predicted TIM-barrel fold metal-dependent hydrolase